MAPSRILVLLLACCACGPGSPAPLSNGAVAGSQDAQDLDPSFYGRLAGRYDLGNGCQLVVTLSVVRLFARDSCTQEWRGLNRVSETVWTGGDRVLSPDGVDRYEFDLPPTGPAVSLTRRTPQGVEVARRHDPYERRDVEFASADATTLRGTIWTPRGRASGRGTVLVHGSGPQDRNGFASIIAVLADALAARGDVVLAYDKRGSGRSAGHGNRAGFDVLAADAGAAMAVLRRHEGVGRDRVGLAGSSQAGWVVAEAIRQRANPSHVVLLGAAGSAISVEEQNLYNTEVRMGCAGIKAESIALGLRQQRLFFDFIAGRATATALDTLTKRARLEPELADWLFPSSEDIDRDAGAWFTVLDLDFDPLPAWRGYAGDLTLVFAEHDDSTPTNRAVAVWRTLNAERQRTARIVVLPGAQHLGLETTSPCDGEVGPLRRFHPGLFAALEESRWFDDNL